ncbi:MAG TPA: hypothetical protein VL728_04005 [Cyclobacteriaceae bacterium]|nr:hypothetical protein [Cyclobacteriaceae bacterium]
MPYQLRHTTAQLSQNEVVLAFVPRHDVVDGRSTSVLSVGLNPTKSSHIFHNA